MTDCPTDDRLRGLLDESDESGEEQLIDHLGQCEVCRERLQRLSFDGDPRDGVDTLLADDEIAWPESHALFSADDLAPTELAARTRWELDRSHSESNGKKLGSDHWETQADSSRDRFGDYDLLRQVGAGGMGVVYKARQKSANRTVAVKLIRPDQLAMLPADRRQVWKDRFRGEAQAAARLDHENVVTIYDVGEVEGTLYYSMQFIDGRSLSAIVRESPIENQRVAALIAKVAQAVDHAHQQGVLHRDIKPQNILVRETSRTNLASGSTLAAREERDRSNRGVDRPYVADFGLAKTLDEGVAGSTHTGEVMGSPSFMSPEQAKDASRCTTASDVYSLGATLYYALTGRAPFRASSSLETLRQVIDEDPVPPRELNRAIELDLQTITLKALSKEPARRYASAADLADDLYRYLDGKPIQARPVSSPERLFRWCRRNPAVAALTGGIAVLLTVVATVSLLSSIQLREHVRRERQARLEAEEYFSVSLDVIHNMVTNYASESLEHVPRMQQARRDLLNRALRMYTRLSRSRPSNPQLLVGSARTRYRIAVLHDLLGEVEQAKTAYSEAIELFGQLRKELPDDQRLRLYWSQSHAMLGETLRKTDPGAARKHFDDALVVQQDLHDRFPHVSSYDRERSRTLNNLGLLLTETGEFGLAEHRLLQAIDSLRTLATAEQLDSKKRSAILADLGRSEINLGVLLRKTAGRSSEARVWYERAIENLNRTVALEPENRDHRFRLAVAEVDLGNFLLLEVADGKEPALRHASSAATRFAQLSDEYPGIPIYRYESANARNSVAGTLAMLGRMADSMSEFERAASALEKIEDEFPEYVGSEAKFHSLRGRILGGIAFLKSQDNDWKSAADLVARAIASQETALQLQPLNPEIFHFLGQHREFQATVLKQLSTSK
ncbi:MAG: serine/threonine-protein kinase [Planctomycetota bacterium]